MTSATSLETSGPVPSSITSAAWRGAAAAARSRRLDAQLVRGAARARRALRVIAVDLPGHAARPAARGATAATSPTRGRRSRGRRRRPSARRGTLVRRPRRAAPRTEAARAGRRPAAGLAGRHRVVDRAARASRARDDDDQARSARRAAPPPLRGSRLVPARRVPPWFVSDAAALSPQATHGLLAAQREHADTRRRPWRSRPTTRVASSPGCRAGRRPLGRPGRPAAAPGCIRVCAPAAARNCVSWPTAATSSSSSGRTPCSTRSEPASSALDRVLEPG